MVGRYTEAYLFKRALRDLKFRRNNFGLRLQWFRRFLRALLLILARALWAPSFSWIEFRSILTAD
jgi:hypothetical protein